jgi:YD repeat-containing protein
VKAIFVDTGKLSQNEANTALGTDGGYVRSGGNANWWIPAGKVFFDVNADVTHPASTAAQELAEARKHFFMPRKFTDPFGQSTTVTYDSHDLLVKETRDALDNVVTVNTQDDAGNAAIRNDYRVLQPYWVTDPNHNRTRVAFDALGLVVATAVMGKPPTSSPPRPAEGEELDSFDGDDASRPGHPAELREGSRAEPGTVKGTQIVYDLDRFSRCG